MDGIQWACSGFIIPKHAGHRLTLSAWRLALFSPFFCSGLATRHSVMNSPDGTLSPSQVLNMTLASLPPQSHALLWINPDTLLQCCLPTAKPQPRGSKEEQAGQSGYSSLCRGGLHPSISRQCVPSWTGFHPLYNEADSFSLAMFSCFASSTSRNPGRRWATYDEWWRWLPPSCSWGKSH